MGFRENVLQLLKDKGLSQSDLAKMIDKPRQNVSTLLKKDSPSMATINEFAKALEVEPADLLAERHRDQSENSKTFSPKTQGSRLASYLKKANMEVKDAAQALFLSVKELNELIEGQEIANAEEIYERIFVKFKDLSSEWLLYGLGKMLISNRDQEAIKYSDLVYDAMNVEVVERSAGTEFRKLRIESYLLITPYISPENYEEYIRSWSERKTYSLSVLAPKHAVTIDYLHFGDYLSFFVTDDSMECYSHETIFKGSIVTGRKIESKYWQNITYLRMNKFFLIHYTEGIVIRKVLDIDLEGGYMIATATNPEYKFPEQKVFFSEIRELFTIEVITQPRLA